MTSSFPMKKNTATKIVFPILDADGDPVTGAAGLDSEYSLDGGAFADCASEATEISGGIYYLNLANGETNGDVVCIQVKTSTSGAKTTVLVFYTAAQTLDETDVIADAIKAKTDNLPSDPADESLLEAEINANETKIDALQTDVTAIKGYVDTEVAAILAAVDTEVAAIKAKTDNLPADPADESAIEAAITAAHATTNAKIDAVDDYVDTEIAAIKAITDTLTLANIADAVLDEVVDANNPANANSLREVVNVISATLAGKSSGGGTNTIKFRDLGDTKDRINATVTAVGDRTAVTQDGT